MNAGALCERDQRILAQALEAQKITDLEICRTIHGLGSHRGMHFLEIARMLRKSPRQSVRDLNIVRMAVGRAAARGLITDEDNTKEHYENVYELTDAGRFVLRTAVTGPKAHSILDEIEAEMAGEA